MTPSIKDAQVGALIAGKVASSLLLVLANINGVKAFGFEKLVRITDSFNTVDRVLGLSWYENTSLLPNVLSKKIPSTLGALKIPTRWFIFFDFILKHIKKHTTKMHAAIGEGKLFENDASILGDEEVNYLNILIAAEGPAYLQMMALNTRLLMIESEQRGSSASPKRGATSDGMKGQCFDFRKWTCTCGESRKFSHDKDAIIALCHDFSRGDCPRSESCPFAHGMGSAGTTK